MDFQEDFINAPLKAIKEQSLSLKIHLVVAVLGVIGSFLGTLQFLLSSFIINKLSFPLHGASVAGRPVSVPLVDLSLLLLRNRS